MKMNPAEIRPVRQPLLHLLQISSGTMTERHFAPLTLRGEDLEVENSIVILLAGPGIGVTLNMPALENVTESTEVIQ